MKIAFLIFALCGSACLAKELTIFVTEITFEKVTDAAPGNRLKTLQKHTAIAFDTVRFVSTDTPIFRDVALASVAKYAVSDRKLVRDGRQIVPADRVLFQGVVEGLDFVVIQATHVSANPLYWPAAISGHPIQFGDIMALSISSDGKTKIAHLIPDSRAADWRAEVFERGPNKALEPTPTSVTPPAAQESRRP